MRNIALALNNEEIMNKILEKGIRIVEREGRSDGSILVFYCVSS